MFVPLELRIDSVPHKCHARSTQRPHVLRELDLSVYRRPFLRTAAGGVSESCFLIVLGVRQRIVTSGNSDWRSWSRSGWSLKAKDAGSRTTGM